MSQSSRNGEGLLSHRTRAAQYVRMSTDHQKYSTENQKAAIRQYADQRGIEIVRTYADEGKSGLTFDGRAALQELIADVQSGNADYAAILIHDVSRWGRFQDVDESAYYEHLAQERGLGLSTAPSCSRTMGHRCPPSSRASKELWQLSTACLTSAPLGQIEVIA